MLTLENNTHPPDELPEADDPVDPPDEFDGDDDGDGEPVRWVTVSTFWNPAEAHIARIKLESEAIDCMIVDENVIATQWLWANALGGIKLQVPQDQASRAYDLLQTRAAKSIAAADGEPLFDGQVKCPRCGSDDLYMTRFSRKFSFLSMIFIGLPLPFVQRRKRCAACGLEWKPD